MNHVGDLVAHIKFTVLLMPNGSDKVTSHQLQELQPTKSIEDNAEIKAWLALGTKSKKKGGGKKKKGCSSEHKASFFFFHTASYFVPNLIFDKQLHATFILCLLSIHVFIFLGLSHDCLFMNIGKKGDAAEPMEEATNGAPSQE